REPRAAGAARLARARAVVLRRARRRTGARRAQRRARAGAVRARAAGVLVRVLADCGDAVAPARAPGRRVRGAPHVGARPRERARQAVRGQRRDANARSAAFGGLRLPPARGDARRAPARRHDDGTGSSLTMLATRAPDAGAAGEFSARVVASYG